MEWNEALKSENKETVKEKEAQDSENSESEKWKHIRKKSEVLGSLPPLPYNIFPFQNKYKK